MALESCSTPSSTGSRRETRSARIRSRGGWLAWADMYMELAKARLSGLVVTTTAVGFLVCGGSELGFGRLVWTLVGTALAAGGANALNQWVEARRDGLMDRTRSRPVPSGAMGRGHALIVALGLAVGGPVLLAVFVNGLTAFLAVLTISLYIFVYTPLKTRSPACTLVGAVCGAIPPMMGCSAALGYLDHRAWILFAILFAWQIPHFLALAWLYREDYARGGFRMLPVIDSTGTRTGRLIVLYSLTLVPLAVTVTLAGVAGWTFAIGAIILGGLFLALSIRLDRDRTDTNARRVFLASLVYLPVLLGLMVLDRGPGAGVSPSWVSEDLAIVGQAQAQPTDDGDRPAPTSSRTAEADDGTAP